MEKESGEGAEAAGKVPPDGLPDAVGLFGAYRGRDGGGQGSAQAQAQAQAAQAALFSFGSRYPPPTTLGVAANQAASLGLHPAASAAWWPMASHLAAKDYLTRLQASRLHFPPHPNPYSALSQLSAASLKYPQKPAKPPSRNDRSGRSSTSSSASTKEKGPSTSNPSSQPNLTDWASTYGFRKTSSPSTMYSQSLSSLASLNSLVGTPHQSKSSKPQPSQSSKPSSNKERESALLRSEVMHAQAQAGAHGTPVRRLPLPARAAVVKGKSMPPLYPFSMPGSEKDRHGGMNSLTGLPQTISSDPSRVLGGVRLPPDTEFIKYTSSLAGPKVPPGTTNRGRKKTISLDPPHVSVHPSSEGRGTPQPKRQKVEDYSSSTRSGVEVIRLPNKPDRGTPPPNLADYAEKGLNITGKSNNSEDSPLDLGSKSAVDEDALLNLSLKPTPPSTQASDALSRLTSLSSSLNASSANDRSSWPTREGRPRNLGRGVSKPKENTVASLLAQSRALGLRPALARLLLALAETDLEKLKSLLGESASTDSECPSDSCPSDSDASDTGRRSHDAMLRLPAALGWKRVTVIKGLSRNCNIKGDVTYTPPEPHAAIKITNMQELQAFLEQNPCPALSAENFNFSGRVVLGDYVQPSETGDPLLFNEVEITKRLEDARLAMVALTGPRPTPPPLDRRIELARRQQAARDARRDASARSRDQALLVKELESSEKAKIVNREREARSQQLLEHINENRTQLTIEALPMEKEKECKIPESSIMPPISLSPIPVTGPKENSPIKTLNFEHERKEDTEEYNALDKMKDFSEKAIFDLPKRNDSKPNSPSPKIQENKENDIEKLIESHSRINEFINDSDWTNLRTGKTDIKSLEEKYLDAKNEFMSHLMLMPKGEEQSSEIRKVGKDGALSISVQQKELSERERRRQHTSFIRQLDSRKRWEERERRKHQNLLDRLLAKEKKLQQRRKEAELTELSPQEDSTLSDQKPLPTLNRIPGLKLPGEAFAYLLQVYEFLHNFWQILEFKMEAIPSLNTLQQALLPDCCPDAEKDLVKLLTELLITALDDPGMPGLDRYTTLMGHAILIEDIKPENLSEYLRLYLYANATDEVNALTGLTPEPDCEGRVPDHHQNDSELQATLATTKNLSYYEHLHNNNTYKLSAALRDKPFLALNSTTKAKILSYLCDELLQNKSVLQQIDGSLEHLNQLKKERYLMDMKIRKVRLLHQRKVRAEQKGKQKALSLERMQKSTANLNRVTPHPVDEQHSKKSETPKKSETTDEPSPLKESDKEFSPIKDLNQKQIDNNKDECSKDNGMDKDSVMCLESEGTQPEEDEDKNLSSEELSRKLEKLMRHSEQQQQQLIAGSHALRATCYGQDRYWRRYWSLGHCGGIFVEGMESAQPEIIRQLDEVEEMDQLQHCKVQISGHYVPKELRYGWWRITDPEQVKEVMDALHPRGVRERELHAAFLNQLPTVNNKIYLEKGDEQNTELSISHLDRVIAQNGGYPRSDSPTDFSASAARRVDLHLLSMVEHTENVVVLGSLQEKGWRPSRLPLPEAATGAEIVARARHKLAAVEAHIERRYLKPPLVQSTAEANIGAALQAEHDNTSAPSPPNDTNEGKPDNEGMPCELEKWREAVARCQSSAQLAMLLKILDKAIAWDKSFIWTVKCQFCLRDDNSGELLLCDGCDKGYHTYCFKPPMEKITDGDWYCWECVNKARGYRVCIVCGGTGEGRTLPCALCSKAYHADCHYPPLNKNPRGKWYCTQCISRAPLEKPRRKRETRRKDNSMDCDQNTEPRSVGEERVNENVPKVRRWKKENCHVGTTDKKTKDGNITQSQKSRQ